MLRLPLVLAALLASFPVDAQDHGVREADTARLRELLHGRNAPQQQAQAALLLVQDSTPKSAEEVREALRRWDRADVFQVVCVALRLQQDNRFEAALLKALESDQSPIRQAALETLAVVGDARLPEKLGALAADRSRPTAARQAAVGVLGRMAHKSAAGALVPLLQCDSEAVRQEALAGLESITGHIAGDAPPAAYWKAWWESQANVTEEQWLAGRNAFLLDRSRRLREDLSHAETHIVQLHQQLYARTPMNDRPGQLRVLGRSEYAAVRVQTVAWIIELLPDAEKAAQKNLIETLLLLSRDGVESVQRGATLALEKVNDPQAFERLLMLLGAELPSVRAAAARSLGRCRLGDNAQAAELNNQAVAALEKALSDPSLAVVAEAAESLGSLGLPASAPILARLLKHSSEPVRQAAARGLERVGGPVVLADLQTGLNDSAASVRFSLVAALGKAGSAADLSDQQRIGILKRLETVLVHDADPGVRSRAATVIGDLGGAAELPLLWQRVLANEDNRVQLKAWNAMIDILSRSLNPALVQQWDQNLTERKQFTRRLELLTELRARWLKQESAKPHLDEVSAALVQAALAQRRWAQALPLALDLARRASSDAELKKRLRWLLVAGNQALDEQKPQEVQQLLNDIQGLLAHAGDLAPEFDRLRQRLQQSPR